MPPEEVDGIMADTSSPPEETHSSSESSHRTRMMGGGAVPPSLLMEEDPRNSPNYQTSSLVCFIFASPLKTKPARGIGMKLLYPRATNETSNPAFGNAFSYTFINRHNRFACWCLCCCYHGPAPPLVKRKKYPISRDKTITIFKDYNAYDHLFHCRMLIVYSA